MIGHVDRPRNARTFTSGVAKRKATKEKKEYKQKNYQKCHE